MAKNITVRQAKYLVDRWNRGDNPRMYREYMDIVEGVVKKIIWDDFSWERGNALYDKIWKQIENEAKRLVEWLKPKIAEITEKINQVSQEYNEIKKKQEKKSTKTLEKQLEEKRKELDDITKSYDKLYEDTQKELDDYKIKVITEDNRGVCIMEISDKEYDVIDFFYHWTIDEDKKDITRLYESKIDDNN